SVQPPSLEVSLFGATQAPLSSQTFGGKQSAIESQLFRHSFPTQRYAPQETASPLSLRTVASSMHVTPRKQLPLALHALPGAHSASFEHEVLHAPSPHAYGSHAFVCSGGQLPLPSHTADEVARASAQVAARHVTSLPTKPAHFVLVILSQTAAEQGSLSVPA